MGEGVVMPKNARLESVDGLFSGPLSLARAAHILRLPVHVVQEALYSGELPAVERHGELHVDGPVLLASFRTPIAPTRRIR
jgi:hypothetical protein